MNRCTSRSIWNHLSGHALLIAGSACLAVACLAIASPAQAGIGNPLKKLKEKAAKAAGQKTEPEEAEAPAKEVKVVFDDVTVELTNDRVERILATFRGAREASAGRPALVEKLNKVSDEREAHAEKHWEKIQAVRLKRSEIESCYHDGYQEAQSRKTEEYQDKALTDPTIREKFSRVAQENNAAAARGDTTAQSNIMKVLMAEMLPSSEDSAKVRQGCGPLPPRSAAEDRLDALDKEIASLNERIRQIDEKIADAQAKEGGLNHGQWGVALDRLQSYLSWNRHNSNEKSQSKSDSKSDSKSGAKSDSKSGGQGSGQAASGPPGFSQVELVALEKHLEELRASLGY